MMISYIIICSVTAGLILGFILGWWLSKRPIGWAQHIKTGRIYKIRRYYRLFNATNICDGDCMVMYSCKYYDDQKIYVREKEEFNAKFEILTLN